MELLVILFLCTLASSKVTLQGFFSKRNVKTFVDGIFFNGIIFLCASLVFLKNAFNCSVPVIGFGFAFGLLTLFFQLCYIKAMSYGNVSITVLIVNLSMIIPVFVSIFVFGEEITIMKITGIILIIIALFLSIDKNEKSADFKKWITMSATAFFLNGGLALTQQFFGKTEWKNESSGFVAWSYIVATVLSVLIYLFLKSKGSSTSFKIKPNVFLIGLCVGVILGLFQFFNTRAIATIDGVVLFPAYNGGTLVMSSLLGIIFLKDKLKTNQIISIITGVIAIVIINL